MTGAEIICRVLGQLGIDTVFGLPGSATIPLFEELRQSDLRTILSTSEQAATFSAAGFYRASGRMAAVTTIHGPGFTQTLSGLAEAHHDSTPLLCIVTKPTGHQARKFRLQVLDQRQMAEPVVKKFFEINEASQTASILTKAFSTATEGEPGPVMIQIDDVALTGISSQVQIERPEPVVKINETTIEKVTLRLSLASKPLLYCGQGAFEGADQVRRLAERYSMPVVTTGAGRGVLPEDHALSLCVDLRGSAWRELNALIAKADLLLAVGCKFSHSGSAGFKLEIPSEKLIHVDSSKEVLDANYATDLPIECDAADFFDSLLAVDSQPASTSGWKPEEIERWRQRLATEMEQALPFLPQLKKADDSSCSDLYFTLRRLLPRDTILVTDSGYHQVVARSFWRVLSSRGLIAPTDFQSMGFGIPAAIGAALACPDRSIVAVVGDGGLIMSGMELLTAVREEISLTVLLINDHSLGQIRMEQLQAFGNEHATSLNTPDIGSWCQAMGVNHFLLEGDLETALNQALAVGGVTVIEAVTGYSPQLRRMRTRGLVKNKAKRLLGNGIVASLKRLFGR